MLKTKTSLLSVYAQPRVLMMFILGLSAGLPYLLIFSTLSAWLHEEGVSIQVIGFFAWVGLSYSIKVLWAPLVDNIRWPWLSRWLGHRRSWILLMQIGLTFLLFTMASSNPQHNLLTLAYLSLAISLLSATLDVTIDAYRIEIVPQQELGAITAMFVWGYRTSLLITGAGALYIADYASWPAAYVSMACIMAGCALFTLLFIREPKHPPQKTSTHHNRWYEACIAPLVDFFARYRGQALAVLALVATLRVSDILLGNMLNPFFLELGFSKSEIASIAKVFGYTMTLAGVFLGGILARYYKLNKLLVWMACLAPITNGFFIWLAWVGAQPWALAVAISAENLFTGVAITVFIAYISTLVNQRYTATQFALLSSIMTLPGKLIAGFSGTVVAGIGFSGFFAFTMILGLPAVFLAYYLQRKNIGGISQDDPSPPDELQQAGHYDTSSEARPSSSSVTI